MRNGLNYLCLRQFDKSSRKVPTFLKSSLAVDESAILVLLSIALSVLCPGEHAIIDQPSRSISMIPYVHLPIFMFSLHLRRNAK